MLDVKKWKTLQNIVKEKIFPEEFRASLASMMKLCYESNNEYLLDRVHRITNDFTTILQDVNTRKDGEHVSNSVIEFFPNISLKKGQHAVMFTQTDDDAKEITLKIVKNHKDDALLFTISPNYVSWFEKELQDIKKESIFHFIPPIDETMITSDKKFDKEKAKQIVMKQISGVPRDYSFVKCVTLATSEYLLRLSSFDWESFLDYEDDGSISINDGQSVSWLCLYNFRDLIGFQDIEKILTIIKRCVHAHHAVLLHGSDGKFYKDLDALIRCYDMILRQLFEYKPNHVMMCDDTNIPYLSSLMHEMRKNLRTWDKLTESFEIESKAIEFVKYAHEEILGVTDRIWPSIDTAAYSRIRSNPELTFMAIIPHETPDVKRIKKMGGKFIIDKDHEYIPLGILIVDKRYVGVVEAIDGGNLDWQTVYFTDNREQAATVRKIFEYTWNNHPLRINPYNHSEFEKMVKP